jgi:Glycosyltransferase family 87
MSWNTLTRFQKLCWIAALVWAAIHVGAYIYALASNTHIFYELNADTNIYVDAARALAAHTTPYDMGDGPWQTDQNYRYHPAFALAFSVLAQIPEPALSIVWMLLLTLSYVVGVLLWYKVVTKLQNKISTGMFVYLPIAFITADWLGNLAFGNAGPIMIPLSALLILGLLDRKPARSGVLVAILLVMKIYWAGFPLVLLFVFKEWKLLIKILVWAFAVYVGITAVYVIIVGPDYGIRSLQDYVVFLLNSSRRFPWRGTEVRFNTLNNAIQQTIMRYFGFVDWAAPLPILFQVLAAALVLQHIWKAWQAKVSRTNKPEVALMLGFAVYLVGILALIQIEDVLLGGVVFSFLWAFRVRNVQYALIGFIVYAFVELPSLISMATGIAWLALLTSYPTVLLAVILLFWGCLGLTRARLAEKVGDLVPETGS